jgi:hypothetical protein
MRFPVSMLSPSRLLAVCCLAAALSMIFACSDDGPTELATQPPSVMTGQVSAITGAKAQCGGTVTDDNGGAVTARGVCWSTDTEPTVLDAHTSDGTGTGDFISSLAGLISSTTYHVRAYATNSAGTSYGDTVSFATGAYVDEGSGGSPLDITGSLPYSGEVSTAGYSNYRITGETPSAIYTTVLARTDGLPYQVVPNAAGSGGIACGWNNDTPGDTIDCAMRATAEGVLDFAVRGDDTIGGAFMITIAEEGIVNEGTPSDPVVVTSFPFSGGALIQSYYLLTGLVPGGAYAAEFVEASSPVALFLFPDDTYQQQPDICYSLNGSGSSCNVAADASGQLYLLTNAQQEMYGVTYTISITEADVANEGGINTPIDISGRMPYSGMVHLGSSWYLVTGLDPLMPYTVTLADASDNANLYLYGPGWTAAGGRQRDSYFYWANGGGNPIACVSVADTEGEIRIEVRGFDSADGATYTLDIAPGGIPNQGYPGTPVDLTGATPYAGTIYNGPSYYVFIGLAAGTDYTVTISLLTADLVLWVYDDGAFQNQLCYSNEAGTADETCVVQTATGEIHLRVTGASVVLGATFLVTLSP